MLDYTDTGDINVGILKPNSETAQDIQPRFEPQQRYEPETGFQTETEYNAEFKSQTEMESQTQLEPRQEQITKKEQLLNTMHEMANTKIVAEEVWGEIEPTREKCDSLLDEIYKGDFENPKDLKNILLRWRKGDFSKAVEEHNYIWRKLRGNVGIAISLKPDVREEMTKKGFIK